MLRADIARPLLVEKLLAGGAVEARDVSIYHTRAVKTLPSTLLDALSAGSVNWITFTSSSTARNLIDLLGPHAQTLLANVKLASIGPITSKTLRELGLEPTIEAKTFTIDGWWKRCYKRAPKRIDQFR